MSNLSSIDKLPNMAAKTDAVSPCKQITYTTDVTPVKWGYFFLYVRLERCHTAFFMFSNQTCFFSAVKICCVFVAEGGLLKQRGFLLRSFKIALFGTLSPSSL